MNFTKLKVALIGIIMLLCSQISAKTYQIEFEYTPQNDGNSLNLLAVVVKKDTLYAIIRLEHSDFITDSEIPKVSKTISVNDNQGDLKIVNVLYDPSCYVSIRPEDGLSPSNRLRFHLIQDTKTLIINYLVNSFIADYNSEIIEAHHFLDLEPSGADFGVESHVFIIKDDSDAPLVIASARWSGGYVGQDKQFYTVINRHLSFLMSLNKAVPNAEPEIETLALSAPYSWQYEAANGTGIAGFPTEKGVRLLSKLAAAHTLYFYKIQGILGEFTEEDKALISEIACSTLDGTVEERCIIPRLEETEASQENNEK